MSAAEVAKGRSRGKVWLTLVVLAAGLGVVWIVRGRGSGEASGGDAQGGGRAWGEGQARAQQPPGGGGPDRSGGKPGGGAGGGDRVIPVLVARAALKDVPLYLQGLGSVTAYKTVNVRTQVDGRLERVAFREGQPVKQGELLAQIDSRPFTIMLHQAEAALARDEAQLQGARKNLERYETVVQQKLIPQQQVDDQRALTQQLEGTVKADQAQIENAKLQIDYAHIKSPIEGVTGIRIVDPGNVVHAADANGIVVVTQLDPIAVIFTLPQDDLGRIAPRQAEGPLVVEASSREGDELLATGKLELVDNQINQTTATIRLKAIFPNPKRVLWPNQFVKARLRLGVRKGTLVVPAAAVQHGPQGTFVYVVGDDGRAALRTVDVDSIENDLALLKGGVAPGERVVSEGQNQLRPGARVSVREAGGGHAGKPPGSGDTGGAGNTGGSGPGRPGPGGSGSGMGPGNGTWRKGKPAQP
jgi:multidrug efflux system membrane fusion protein